MTPEEKAALRKACEGIIALFRRDCDFVRNYRQTITLLDENESIEESNKYLQDAHIKHVDKIQDLQSLNARLVAMLKDMSEYIRHDEGCSAEINPEYLCRCGYLSLFLRLRQTLEGDKERGI